MCENSCLCEYAAKKKLTRRDRFLAEIDKVTHWPQWPQLNEPFYPRLEGTGRPPIGLARMLRIYVAQQFWAVRRRHRERDLR